MNSFTQPQVRMHHVTVHQSTIFMYMGHNFHRSMTPYLLRWRPLCTASLWTDSANSRQNVSTFSEAPAILPTSYGLPPKVVLGQLPSVIGYAEH